MSYWCDGVIDSLSRHSLIPLYIQRSTMRFPLAGYWDVVESFDVLIQIREKPSVILRIQFLKRDPNHPRCSSLFFLPAHLAPYVLSYRIFLINPKTYCELHPPFQRFCKIETNSAITDIDNISFYRRAQVVWTDYESGSYDRNTLFSPIFVLLHIRLPTYSLSVDDVLTIVKVGYYPSIKSMNTTYQMPICIGLFVYQKRCEVLPVIEFRETDHS